MANTQQVFGGLAVPRNISLPSELNDALTERAQREDRPVSWIVRRALVAYLSDQQAIDEAAGDNSRPDQ